MKVISLAGITCDPETNVDTDSVIEKAGVELPTSPYTSKDKGRLVNLPNN